MHAITVKKEELLKKLTANRDAHRAIFLEAQAGFRKRVVEELDRRLEAARKGEAINLHIGLVEPQDHTDDYERVICMLEMDQAPTVELEEHDFAQYVMDDWGWSIQSLTANSAYSVSAARTLSAKSKKR